MTKTKIDVKKIAKLANLSLSDEKLKEIEKTFSSIIEHMEVVKNLDVDNIPETTRLTEEENVWREDKMEQSLTQEEALSNAKKTYNGFFIVPIILEEAVK